MKAAPDVTRDLADSRFENRLNNGNRTVKKLGFWRSVGDGRDALVDGMGDISKWIDKAFDKEKYKEIETLGGPVKLVRAFDDWARGFGEPKVLSYIDKFHSLYKLTWQLPENLAKYTGALWYILTQKVRNEKALGKEKKEAAKLRKDPVKFIRENRELFDSIDMNADLLNKATEFALTGGEVSVPPEKYPQLQSALDYTKNPTSFGPNSPEFRSYLEIKAEVLSARAKANLNEADQKLVNSNLENIIATGLQEKMTNPNAPLNLNAIFPPNIAAVLARGKMTDFDIVGDFDSAYQKAQSMVDTINTEVQLAKKDRETTERISMHKAIELKRLFPGSAVSVKTLAQEVKYIAERKGNGMPVSDIARAIEADVRGSLTGDSPVTNLINLFEGDLQKVVDIISYPTGALERIQKKFFLQFVSQPAEDLKPNIILLIDSSTSFAKAKATNPFLADEIETMLGKTLGTLTEEEFTSLKESLNKDGESLTKLFTEMRTSAGIERVDIEVYSYMGLPPFASGGEINESLKYFEPLNKAHQQVVDVNTGSLQPKFANLGTLFQQLHNVDKGLMEDLVQGGFFFFGGQDKAGLASTLKMYKGQDKKKLKGLEGSVERQTLSSKLNPINGLNNFLDLDYSPNTRGIISYLDRLYGAAKRAGINQSMIDTLLLEKQTFTKNAEGNDDSADAAELSTLAMYTIDSDKVVETAKSLGKVVATAQMLINNSNFKGQYDHAVGRALQKDEGISDRKIRSRYVKANGSLPPESMLGIPEEIIDDPRALNLYKANKIKMLQVMDEQVNEKSIENFLDQDIMTDSGLYNPRELINQAQDIGNMFLQSPVDAQRLQDILYIMMNSQNIQDAFLDKSLFADLQNPATTNAQEVIALLGISSLSPEYQRTILSQIRSVGQKFYNKVINTKMKVFGWQGMTFAFDPSVFAHFIHLFLGNLNDYANATTSVKVRISQVNSFLTRKEKGTDLANSTSDTVELRRKIAQLFNDYKTRQKFYLSQLNSLSSGSIAKERNKVIQEIRTERFDPAVFDDKSRTLRLIYARSKLNRGGKRLRESEDRVEYGKAVLGRDV